MKILIYPVLFFWCAGTALAESPSRDWSGSYNFPSSGTSTFRLLQSDLIEKKDGGYYDSFGPASLSVYSTNTVGTLNNYNTNIDGEDNVVVNDSTSTNSGNLNGSISLIDSSTINSNDVVNSTVNNNRALLDD